MKKLALAIITVAVFSIGACKKDDTAPKKKAFDVYKDNTGWDVDQEEGQDTTAQTPPVTTP